MDPVISEQCFFLYDVAPGSETKPCIKINKPLVVSRFSDRY